MGVRRSVSLSLFVLTFTAASASAGTQQSDCKADVSAPQTAKLFGEVYEAPEWRLEFRRARSGEAVIPHRVNIHYVWEWLNDQNPDFPFGNWQVESERIVCAPKASALTVPARTIRTRGWYDGKYTRFPFTLAGSKKPRFYQIEINASFDGCVTPKLALTKPEIKKWRDNTVTLSLTCENELPKVSLAPKRAASTK